MDKLSSLLLIPASLLAGCSGGSSDSAPRNEAPTITPVTLVFQEDALMEIRTLQVRDPQGDSFDLVYVTPPAHGRLDGPGARGQIVYTPDANYNGPDSFVVRAVDTGGTTSPDVTIPI